MRNRSTKERRIRLENLIREHKDEFEALLPGTDKGAIKSFVNNKVRPVMEYGEKYYYYDIYFALRRCYFRLFKTE